MDESRGLLIRVGGAMFALVVFAVGMKYGCGSCDDPERAARSEALKSGCTAAGFEAGSPKFGDCVEKARASCKGDDPKALKECATGIGATLR